MSELKMWLIINACLLLVSLCFCSPGRWSESFEVDNSVDKPCNYASSFYMEPVTSISYILYTRQKASSLVLPGELCVKKLYTDNILGDAIIVDNRSASGEIKGMEDGKNFLIAEYGMRSYEGECSLKDTRKCYDIFLIESNDGGDTWTKPIQVQRPNLKDPIDRESPTILYIKETKRAYVFYYFHTLNNERYFAFVTRPPGSRYFTSERVIIKEKQIGNGFGVAYTIKKNGESVETVLHIVWPEFTDGVKYFFQYSSSKDGGANWEKPRNLGTSPAILNKDAFYPLASDPGILSSTIFFTYAESHRYALMRMSSDHGQNWTEPIEVIDADINFITQAFCGDQKNQMLFIIGTNISDTLFSTYNPNTKELRERDKPFFDIDKEADPIAVCRYDSNANNYYVKAISNKHERNRKSYYAYIEINNS